MESCDSPDMYAFGPAALMPLGIHIRQISLAHVTPITYMPDTY